MDAVGQITLSVTFGQGDNARTEDVIFDVVDLHYPYNAILGRASLNRFEAIPHHNYLCMKMPGPKGVITIWGDQGLAREIEFGRTPGQKKVYTLDAKDDSKATLNKWSAKAKPEGDTKKVPPP